MRGVSSAHAFSHNGYTVQSRRHIFTGSVADIRLGTLIDDFNANGYETAYFSGQDESFGGVGGQVGFGRASVRYDARDDVERRYSTFSTAGSLAVPFNVVTERVGEFLAKRQQSDRPLFLHVNFHDTHFPYHHAAMQARLPGPVLEQFEIRPERASDLRAMYLNSAANVDRAIGDVLSRLRAASQGDPAVIVLSDHGESLFDEGFLGHGYALNDAQTRIPLIVANLPLVIAEPFGQADLRDALRRAPDAPRGGSPTLRQDRDRPVFQYLGLLERPAQIAFTRLDGQTVYDFRTRRVQFGGGAWRRVEDLDTTERAQFLALANRWERMVIARSR
jgi:arylsulfatase A-like enzyme